MKNFDVTLTHFFGIPLKCETKTKLMDVTGPVQSHYHEGSPIGSTEAGGLSHALATYDPRDTLA